MPRGIAHAWTREELEDVMACSGTDEHAALAERLEVAANTIYSIRGKVRNLGGIDAFLERQHIAGDPLKPRKPESLTEQLARIYLISLGGASRDGLTTQYHVTIPSRIAERFVDLHGRNIRFEPREDGILIVPVAPPATPVLPSWIGDDAE